MRESTKKILDAIIQQWCDNKIYVTVMIDSNGHEIYTVVKETAKSKGFLKRRLSDRFKDNKDTDDTDFICKFTITSDGENHYGHIHYKSCYSIDEDFSGIYNYIRKFLAIIKSKVRQLNNFGVQVQLGLADVKEFDKFNDSFNANKNEIIQQIYNDKEEINEC